VEHPELKEIQAQDAHSQKSRDSCKQ